MKKIFFLSKTYDNFSDIYNVKKNYYKQLKPIMKEGPKPPQEEEGLQSVLNVVKDTSEKYNEFEEEMYQEILGTIKDLIDKMKKEKGLFDDYIKFFEKYKED